MLARFARLACCLLGSTLALVAVPACEPEPGPTSWSVGLERDQEFGALLSVWGPERSEIYAVGGNPDAGAMIRFDGAAWVDSALPPGFPLANWIFGFASTEPGRGTILWVAGNHGQVARRAADGQWAVMDLASDLGTDSALWGIWGAADDDVWTVGGDIPGDDPVLAHWDGSAWTRVPLPALDREFAALLKVWGTGAEQVFALGHRGVVLHHSGEQGPDGPVWTQQLAGTSADLISLWGTGPDQIVAVGGRSNAVIARYDGTAWTSETIGQLPGLNGVWLDADGTGFAVGGEGVVIEIAPNSFTWTELDRQARPDVLHGGFGLADGARFGVGGNLLFSPPWTAIVVQYLP
jgi:hypothetical protein